jgi:rubredoxin
MTLRDALCGGTEASVLSNQERFGLCEKPYEPIIQAKEVEGMDRYVCSVCGYVYDPEQGDPDNGVAAGTKFEDLPEDWVCPVCGAGKEDFEKEE